MSVSNRTGSVQIARGQNPETPSNIALLKVGELFYNENDGQLYIVTGTDTNKSITPIKAVPNQDISIDTLNGTIKIGNDVLGSSDYPITFSAFCDRASRDGGGNLFEDYYLSVTDASSTYVNKNTENTIVKSISRGIKSDKSKDSISITEISNVTRDVTLPTTYWGTSGPNAQGQIPGLSNPSAGDIYIKYQ